MKNSCLQLEGNGILRTYNDSYLSYSFNSGFLHSYKNEVYKVSQASKLEWGSNEDEYDSLDKNNKVEIINVILLPSDKAIFEYINYDDLYKHLIDEAQELNQAIGSKELNTNAIITGRIPVSGEGFHKTYIESVIRLISNKEMLINNINGELFISKIDGSIYWEESVSEYEDMLNDDDYMRVNILKIYSFDDKVLLELINPKILDIHLKREEMIRSYLSTEDRIKLKLHNKNGY